MNPPASDSTGLGPASVLWMAGAAGLLTGVGEVTLLGIQKYGLHRFLFLSRDVIWMAPLGDLVLFLVAGLLVVAVTRSQPRHLTWPRAVGLFAALGLMSLLFMYPPLHRAAGALLAVGGAIQLSRLLAPRRQTLERMTPRLAVFLAAGVLCTGVGLRAQLALAELRGLDGLTPARPGAPNVLLIILDTVRGTELSLYGYPKTTSPHLDGFARRGVAFDRAFATAPWTLASHATIFTGRLPHQVSADWHSPLAAGPPTLAEQLRDRGYYTAGFVGNIIYTTYETGLDRGFLHYEDYPITLGQIVKSCSLGRASAERFQRATGIYQRLDHKSAETINRDFLHWLDGAGPRPFFVFLNYFDTHSPYLPPAPYDGRFGPTGPRTDIALEPHLAWDSAQVTLQRNAYDATLAYLDTEVGALLDSLDRRGLLEHTVVVIAGDHGEEFYEHQVMEHGNSLYRPSLQVPLIVALPGRVPEGRRIGAPVSLRDLPATVLDLAGAVGRSPIPGRSLARFWGDSLVPETDTLVAELSPTMGLPDPYPASRDSLRSLVIGGLRYIRTGTREELYDFQTDTLERHDLAGTVEGQKALAGFREAVRLIWQDRSPRVAGNTPP